MFENGIASNRDPSKSIVAKEEKKYAKDFAGLQSKLPVLRAD